MRLSFGLIAFAGALAIAFAGQQGVAGLPVVVGSQKSSVPIDSLTGLPIPLLEGQKVIPTLTPGCAVIVSRAEPLSKSLNHWSGGCRFGLVHGRGYWTSDGKHYPALWQIYGSPMTGSSPFAAYERHYGGMYSTYGEPGTGYSTVLIGRTVILQEGGFTPNSLDASITFVEINSLTDQSNSLSIKSIRADCGKEYYLTLSTLDQEYVKIEKNKYCDLIKKESRLAYILILKEKTKLGSDGQWVKEILSEKVSFCATVPAKGLPACGDAFKIALAPYLTEILDIVEQSKTAQQKSIDARLARFAPLEAAARDKIKAWASKGQEP